ncbi:ComF family protein [Desulfonatronum thiosulfatophilum]|nr:ComF family protein [Desulfonatronum thiosulfatophilum]
MARLVQEYFPALNKRCPVCGALKDEASSDPASTATLNVCAVCRSRLVQRITGYCPRCGKLYEVDAGPPMLCLDCRLSPPPWHNVYFYGPYNDLLKSLVLRFKFQAQLGLGRLLHDLLRLSLQAAEATSHDLIVPIPLHPRKLRDRGFNQSLELSRGISHDGFGNLRVNALSRIRNTPAQHTLPRAQRMQNLKGAFQADNALVHGRTVLLVDDILTTGATAHAAARTLLQAGAVSVDLLVLARA